MFGYPSDENLAEYAELGIPENEATLLWFAGMTPELYLRFIKMGKYGKSQSIDPNKVIYFNSERKSVLEVLPKGKRRKGKLTVDRLLK